MKNFTLLVISIVLSVFTQAQKLAYTEVVSVDSVSAEELFNRARYFVAQTFNDPEYVTKIEDKENGLVYVKAAFYYNPKILLSSALTPGPVRYQLKISVKDNKYKYELFDFYHDSSLGLKIGEIFESEIYQGPLPKMGGKNQYQKIYKDIWLQTISHSVGLISALKTSMNKEYVKDDW